jgi:hypothetical protein
MSHFLAGKCIDIDRANLVHTKHKKGMCTNAEYIQPRIKQFKVNYSDINVAKKQAEILQSTFDYLD